MSITIQDLEQNTAKYINLSQREDILISVNGTVVAKLSNPNSSRVEKIKTLFGILPEDASLEKSREERLSSI